MIRFLLFVGIIWLMSKIVKLIFQGSGTRRQNQNGPRADNFTTPKPSDPQVEFKDVQDAKFVDIPDKENASK